MTDQQNDESTVSPTLDLAQQILDEQARDEQFNALVRELSHVDFNLCLTDSEEAACRVIELGTLSGKNIYRNGNSWVVKYYRGGRQRIWAYYPDIESACRIADLLITQFNSSRSRHKILGTITEDHLNITPERAKADWENENEIRSLILQLDACLPEITKGRKPGAKKGAINQTVAGIVNKRFDALQKQLEELLLVTQRIEKNQLANNTQPVTVNHDIKI